MGLDERFWYLILGGVLGFIVGYVVRSLRDIKEELHEVDEIIKRDHRNHDRDESGKVQMDRHMFNNIALVVVIGICVWAAFSTQKTNNELEETQAYVAQSTECNQEMLFRVIDAVNQRTTYTVSADASNVKLQEAQSEFFKIILHRPPYDALTREEAARTYFEALKKFLDLTAKTGEKIEDNPYPTVEEFVACLEQ